MPWGIAAAVVGGVIASNASKKASKAQAQSARESSDAQLQAQRESIEFQKEQADIARADREPWRLVGANKLAELSRRTVPGGDLIRTFGMSDFQKDPGYQFRLDEGMKGLTNSAAARGGLLSGAALKAASQYNQNFASNEFSNANTRFNDNRDGQYNKLANLAGIGQVAASQNALGAQQLGSQVGNGMLQTGQTIGGNLIGAGNARASGYLAQGNIWSNALNQGVSAWRNNQPPPNRVGETSGGNLDYWRGSNG